MQGSGWLRDGHYHPDMLPALREQRASAQHLGWPVNSNARTREKEIEISKSQIPNFPGLVLFCIDTSDSESRRIFQHFSRSTRWSHLCTAPVLISALFCTFSLKSRIFAETFADFSTQRAFFAVNFKEFCRNCGKLERKHFRFRRGKGKTEGVGKRENEIECREKGNGRAPNLN